MRRIIRVSRQQFGTTTMGGKHYATLTHDDGCRGLIREYPSMRAACDAVKELHGLLDWMESQASEDVRYRVGCHGGN